MLRGMAADSGEGVTEGGGGGGQTSFKIRESLL